MIGHGAGRGLPRGTVILAAIAVATCVAAAPDERDILRQTSRAFTAVAKEAVPAVVFVNVEQTVTARRGPGPHPFNDPFDFFGDDFMERFFGGRQTPRHSPVPPRSFRRRGRAPGF